MGKGQLRRGNDLGEQTGIGEQAPVVHERRDGELAAAQRRHCLIGRGRQNEPLSEAVDVLLGAGAAVGEHG